MKRKMIGAAAAYMSGLFFASFFSFGSGIIIILIVTTLIFILSKRIGITSFDVIMLSVFSIAAMCVFTIYTVVQYDKAVSYDGIEGSFSGNIVSVDYYNDNKALYILDGSLNGLSNKKYLYFGEAYNVSKGDTFKIDKCKLVIPESDYLYNSKEYYKSEQVFMEIVNAEQVSYTKNNHNILTNMLHEYKEQVKSDFIIRTGKENGGLIAGMVFGDKENISDSTKISVYRSGIGHIMAVSGLHVSAVAAVLMFILKKIKVNKYLSFLLMNVMIIMMIIMADSPVSAIRAAIMLNFIYSSCLLRRQNDTFNSLFCAVLIICIFNPYVIYSSGFLLSVSGTFGIGVFAPYMTKNLKADTILKGIFKLFIQMICVSLSILPLSILYFDEVSLISPITNVFIIPLCMIVLFIGILYTFTGGLISLLSVAGIISELIIYITKKLSGLEMSYISCGGNKLFYISVTCTMFVIVTYFLFKNRKLISIAIASSIVVFILSSAVLTYIQRDKFRIAVLGRENNALTVINYRGKAEAIDLSGHYKSSEYLNKYLMENGINELSYLALTSNIQSQYASYISSLEHIKLKNILVNSENKPDENIASFSDDGFTAENNKHKLLYTNGSLCIEFAGKRIEIIPVKKYNGDNNNDVVIAYGNITKNVIIDMNDKNVYLDEIPDEEYKYSGINNFEIIIDDNGKIKIRRL